MLSMLFHLVNTWKKTCLPYSAWCIALQHTAHSLLDTKGESICLPSVSRLQFFACCIIQHHHPRIGVKGHLKRIASQKENAFNCWVIPRYKVKYRCSLIWILTAIQVFDVHILKHFLTVNMWTKLLFLTHSDYKQNLWKHSLAAENKIVILQYENKRSQI